MVSDPVLRFLLTPAFRLTAAAGLRVLVFVGALVASRGAVAAACVGDCGGDGQVAINELIRGVSIALGGELPSACAAFQNAQGQVTIAQLIQAVNNALNGCPPDDGGLAGEPGARALDAVEDVFSAEAYVAPEELSGALVRTQVELAFRKDATVGAVNDLLDRIEGRIVSSRQGVLILVVRIPDPGSVAALDELIAELAAEPVVRMVNRVHLLVPTELPAIIAPGTDTMKFVHQHLAVRAHAAWNARAALASATAPTLVVADLFGDGPPIDDLFGVTATAADFGVDVPNSHGYLVVGIAAGAFDPVGGVNGDEDLDRVTGMFPGTIPLRAADANTGSFRALFPMPMQVHENLMLERVEEAPGKVVLNTSVAYACQTLADAAVNCALDAARMQALAWIERVRGTDWPADRSRDLEPKFLHAAAASNIWPGLGMLGADVSSSWNAATLLSPLVDPGSLEVVPNLTNTLVVENFTATAGEPFRPGCITPSSELGGTIGAIGSPAISFAGPATTQELSDGGTSSATPQVAGLAAYVWALRPGLTPAELVALLQRTAAPADPGCGNGLVIDAYAALLAADEGNPARPVRHAILDVTDQSESELAAADGVFDEHDLALFITQLEAPDSGRIDYGRYDLNGDGRTGFSAAATLTERPRVDLDLDGAYGLATLDVEGLPLRFDEQASSDLRILCHAAYSPFYDGTDESARRDKLGLGRCLDLFLEILFPVTVEPGVSNLLTIRAFDPELTDPADPNQSLGQAGVRIELTVSGGSVDNFFGTTNADGIFQTNARLFDGQPELIIEVVARAGENGPELARTTVRAPRAVTPNPTPTPPLTGDIQSVSLFSGTTPGPFSLGILREDGSGTSIQGALGTVLAELHAAVAGAGHIGMLQISTGNGQPGSFNVSLGSVDVDQLDVFDRACGSTVNVSVGRAFRARLEGCRSTITAQFADIMGDGVAQLQVSGTESSFDVGAGRVENVIVGSPFVISSQLSVDIRTGGINGDGAVGGYASIQGCIDCTIDIGGTVSGGFEALGNAKLSLGPVTLGDVFALRLRDNSFTAFGGITGGDVVASADSFLSGSVTLFGNTNLALSMINIGDVGLDLFIQSNRGFSNDEALAFRQARTVAGRVLIENNAP